MTETMIDRIKEQVEAYKKLRNNGQAFFVDNYEDADNIIKSLEKQIPVKKHRYMGYRCICGKEVAKDQDYCEYCGQKLLPWEEVE